MSHTQKTFSGVPGDSRCECSDPGCPVHNGQSKCNHVATDLLFRVDMEDNTGVYFCDECAADALDSGVFSPYDPDEDETEEN